VTVLGSSSSIPRPARASSSYLVRAAQTSVVLDLGTGGFSNLRRYLAADDIDAVVVSHMHPDHFIDLIPLRYALRYGPRSNRRRVSLYLPPQGEVALRRLVAAFAPEADGDFLADVYDVREYDPEGALEVGAVRVRFAPTAHYIPTFAIRCDVAGASVAYSADTAPSASVAALAADSDLFLCEATLAPGTVEALERGHLTPREAGELGAAARTRRLVLTHYGGETKPGDLAADAATAFAGEITVADDHLRLALG